MVSKCSLFHIIDGRESEREGFFVYISECDQIWRNLDNLAIFCKLLGNLLKLKLVFVKYLCYTLGQISIVLNGPI